MRILIIGGSGMLGMRALAPFSQMAHEIWVTLRKPAASFSYL